MISILLPAYKSEKLLEKVFIPSLQHSTNNIQVILYDNGGNGDIKKFETDKIKIIGNGANIGLNAALNECAKVATGDYFYLCHTDMFLLPDWDTALLNAAKNLAPTSYLFCSRSIEPGYSHIKSQIIKDYGNEVDSFQQERLLKEFNQYVENKVVVNARMPFFMHRQLWNKMSGVDVNYFSYCTDDDLIQTAYNVGVRKFFMIYSSLVYHLQGKSNAQQTVDKDRNEPYEYFIKKWKAWYPNISHPGQYHPILIPFERVIK
jgi:GT2 family glycosyltransferase